MKILQIYLFIVSLDWLLYCTHHTHIIQTIESTEFKQQHTTCYAPADLARTVHNLFPSRLDCARCEWNCNSYDMSNGFNITHETRSHLSMILKMNSNSIIKQKSKTNNNPTKWEKKKLNKKMKKNTGVLLIWSHKYYLWTGNIFYQIYWAFSCSRTLFHSVAFSSHSIRSVCCAYGHS